VVSVATDRADEILGQSQRTDVRAEAFRCFATALDGPPEEMPTLRRYARARSPITVF
jgi:uncharacterized protein (DUF1778 family)